MSLPCAVREPSVALEQMALPRPCQKLASRPRRYCGPRSSGAFRPFPPSRLGERHAQTVGRSGRSIILSRDPLVAMTQSAYGYVNGNPLNDTDPLGLWGLSNIT